MIWKLPGRAGVRKCVATCAGPESGSLLPGVRPIRPIRSRLQSSLLANASSLVDSFHTCSLPRGTDFLSAASCLPAPQSYSLHRLLLQSTSSPGTSSSSPVVRHCTALHCTALVMPSFQVHDGQRRLQGTQGPRGHRHRPGQLSCPC